MEEENQRHDPVEFFTGFPQIQEKILSYLTVPDLLKSSVVSKSWRLACTSVLFSQKRCIAYIGKQSSCIAELLQLNNTISRMDSFPFNSLVISNIHKDHHPCLIELPDDCLDVCFAYVLKIPWKFLSIRLPDCTGNSLMGKILWESRQSIEELVLDCEAEEKSRYFQSEMKGHQGPLFPKLRSVTLPDEREFAHLFALYVVNVAPHLQSIHGRLRLAGLRYFSESQYEHLKNVAILANVHMNRNVIIRPQAFSVVPVEVMTKFATARLGLESLTVISADAIAPSAIGPLCQILRRCSKTLKFLSARAHELVRILQADVVTLPALQTLHLPAMPEGAQATRVVQSLLRKLNIPNVCPKLKTLHVKFHWSAWVNTDEDFRDNELMVHETPQLILEGDRWPLQIIPWIMHCFPLLKVFEFTVPNERDVGLCYRLCQIWDELTMLEELRINAKTAPDDLSMDAFLCGISVAEVQRLLEMHRKGVMELEELQVVPLRPPLQCAKGLKRLRISLGWTSGKSFCLTEVSGFLVFQRMEELEVHIEGPIRACRELSYLLPFGDLTYS